GSMNPACEETIRLAPSYADRSWRAIQAPSCQTSMAAGCALTCMGVPALTGTEYRFVRTFTPSLGETLEGPMSTNRREFIHDLASTATALWVSSSSAAGRQKTGWSI